MIEELYFWSLSQRNKNLCSHKKLQANMRALFVIWKQFKCPSTVVNLKYIYPVEYHWAFKKEQTNLDEYPRNYVKWKKANPKNLYNAWLHLCNICVRACMCVCVCDAGDWTQAHAIPGMVAELLPNTPQLHSIFLWENFRSGEWVSGCQETKVRWQGGKVMNSNVRDSYVAFSASTMAMGIRTYTCSRTV
jgi:hypothetical protein